MKISIVNPATRFSAHLGQPKNVRILFSGRFGTGKSHFLREFFGENADKYNVFLISPIHYVVGGNQDIFEWIKVDIARQLVENYLEESKEAVVSRNFLIQSYIYRNAASIFLRLVTHVMSKFGEKSSGIDVVDALKKDLEEFQKFDKETKDEAKGHWHILNEFITQAIDLKGSIFEDNLTTQIIRANIRLLKQVSAKENVLIIDDMDRLDPEHIFRILNILSAHNDHFDENKFSFDKVIIVCDQGNIEHMYKFRYSEHSDFEGYIEKFFSFEPFNFTIGDAVVEYCNTQEMIDGVDADSRIVLIILLVAFVKHGQLRVRNLKKIASFSSAHLSSQYGQVTYQPVSIAGSTHIMESILGTHSFTIDYSRFDILKALSILAVSFGGIRKLKAALDMLSMSDLTFDTKHLEAIIRSVSVMGHIAKGFPGPTAEIFYHVQQYENPLGVGNLVAPHFSFLGKSAILAVPWHQNGRYTGGSYFERSNPSVILQQLTSEQDWRNICTVKNLVAEVRSIIDFMISEEGVADCVE